MKIYHKHGSAPCNNLAFEYSGPIAPGVVLMAKYVIFPNGEKPVAGSLLRCGACNKICAPYEFEWPFKFTLQ